MPINVLVIKKYAALLMAGFIPILLFIIANMYYDFWWGLGFMFIGMLLSVVLGNLLLSNPFTSMLEGKGLLALNIDSTGIIIPFLIGLKAPYVKGKLRGNKIDDVFDRATVYNLTPPVENQTEAEILKDGGIKVNLNAKEFNKARFGMFHYPVLIYNEQIKSFVTKDFLSNQEKETFAEHGVLYLNRKMEELTGVVRDFGRYVVELTKPKAGFFAGNKWIIWLCIIVFVIILIMFFPSIMRATQGSLGGAGSAIQSAAASGNTITQM